MDQVKPEMEAQEIIAIGSSSDNMQTYDEQENHTNYDQPEQNSVNQIEANDILKKTIDNYDMDAAIQDLEQTMNEASEMFIKLKQIKFEYLTQVCEIYARIDIPSVMMDTCHKSITEKIPSAKDIEKNEF